MAIEAHDFVIDSPTNIFATLANKLQHDATSSAVTDGNLKYIEPSNSSDHEDMSNAIANFSATSGKKWYWEVVILNNTDTNERIASAIGVILQQHDTQGNILYSTDYFGGTCYAWGNDTNSSDRTSSTNVFQRNEGTLNAVSTAQDSYLKHGTVVGVLLDLESSPNTVTLYASGSELSDRGGVTTKMNLAASTQFFPLFGCGTSGGTQIHLVNFGADSSFGGNKTGSANATDSGGIGDFYYSPPNGFKALCTANIQSDLAIDPADDDLPEDYFVCHAYGGDNNNPRELNFSTFQPDLVWIKQRTDNDNGWTDHQICDSVRGSQSVLRSNQNNAVWENPANGTVQSFDNDGFTIQGSASASNANDSNENYISWNWKAGGNENTFNWGNGVGSSNYSGIQTALTLPASTTSGMITPTGMSVGVKQGTSIISYEGTTGVATVPHGLGKEPEFVITKSTDNAYNWMTYHKSAGTTHYTELNLSVAFSNNSATYNGPHDANVIKYGGSTVVDTGNFIVYAFTSIEGYSAFGSYEGNNTDNDGVFVFTGFKPAVLLLRSTSGSRDWIIVDNARSPHNPIDHALMPNTSGVENTLYDNPVDFLSNGFKLKTNEANFNASETHIYACWAEMPQKYAVAR